MNGDRPRRPGAPQVGEQGAALLGRQAVQVVQDGRPPRRGFAAEAEKVELDARRGSQLSGQVLVYLVESQVRTQHGVLPAVHGPRGGDRLAPWMYHGQRPAEADTRRANSR
jgi:hypothetical protein